MAIEMVKALFAWIVSKFLGNVNLDDGMLSEEGMTPMGAGLQEPPAICWPLVIANFVVAQKLMKLLVDVFDAT